MKNLILIVSLLFSISLSSFSQSDSDEPLKTELYKIVTLNKEELPENMSRTEVVLFSFNILSDETINVLDMNYSSEVIRKAVMKKVSQAVLENNSVTNKIHYFKVVFLKL